MSPRLLFVRRCVLLALCRARRRASPGRRRLACCLPQGVHQRCRCRSSAAAHEACSAAGAAARGAACTLSPACAAAGTDATKQSPSHLDSCSACAGLCSTLLQACAATPAPPRAQLLALARLALPSLLQACAPRSWSPATATSGWGASTPTSGRTGNGALGTLCRSALRCAVPGCGRSMRGMRARRRDIRGMRAGGGGGTCAPVYRIVRGRAAASRLPFPPPRHILIRPSFPLSNKLQVLLLVRLRAGVHQAPRRRTPVSMAGLIRWLP